MAVDALSERRAAGRQFGAAEPFRLGQALLLFGVALIIGLIAGAVFLIVQSHDRALAAARASLRLTENQYAAGLVDYLSVAQVETTALSTERAALSLQAQRLVASVQLIAALGGGWQATAAAGQPASGVDQSTSSTDRPASAADRSAPVAGQLAPAAGPPAPAVLQPANK